MEVFLANSKNKLDLADNVFNCDFNEPLIHQVVTAFNAGGRAGTKAQKTRAEVSGGGAKPFRQKGTGRARAGTIRSPIWRKGGIVFAAKPRSYKQKVNRKMFKGAMCSILSELIRQDRMIIVDGFEVDAPKTKVLLNKLTEMKVTGYVLIVSESIQDNLYLASRNLQKVDVKSTSEAMADPVALIRAEHVIFTTPSVKKIEELLK